MTVTEIISGILVREGSRFTMSETDPPTKYGITITDLSEFLDRSATIDEVRNMSEDTARLIYAKKYVKPFLRIEDEDVRIFVIDTCVLSGLYGGTKILQRCLEDIKVDGIFGPLTLVAVNDANPRELKRALIIERMRSLIHVALAGVPKNIISSTDLQYLLGWWNRVTNFL